MRAPLLSMVKVRGRTCAGDLPAGLGRDLVQASLAEGMAAQQAPEGQGRSAQRPVGGDGDGGVLRAGGLKPASARAQGMHRGRKPAAVKAESGEQKARHHAGETMGGAEANFAASARACVRIRTISASSFENSMVRTTRRGWRIRSGPFGQQIEVATQRFPHAALDAIAFVRLAQHLACGQAHAACGQADPRGGGIVTRSSRRAGNCVPADVERETNSSMLTAACGPRHTRAENRSACASAAAASDCLRDVDSQTCHALTCQVFEA